jgi:hypothetical protein
MCVCACVSDVLPVVGIAVGAVVLGLLGGVAATKVYLHRRMRVRPLNFSSRKPTFPDRGDNNTKPVFAKDVLRGPVTSRF